MKKYIILLASMYLVTVNAFSFPTIDGFYSSDEGYTSGKYLNFSYENGGYLSERGQLWTRQDPTNYDVYVAVILPRSIVDNSYGENSIGWKEKGNGKGKGKPKYGHTFGDLLRSDNAIFSVSDSQGNTVIDFALDYIAVDDQAASGYSSSGIENNGKQADGHVIDGDKNALAEWGTSLAYNFNTLGHVLTEDSPSADDDYNNVDPAYSDWVFDTVYEFRIDGSYIGGMGFEINSIETHISPMKTNGICAKAEIGDNIAAVPAPGAFLLGGIGALSLRLVNRKRFEI